MILKSKSKVTDVILDHDLKSYDLQSYPTSADSSGTADSTYMTRSGHVTRSRALFVAAARISLCFVVLDSSHIRPMIHQFPINGHVIKAGRNGENIRLSPRTVSLTVWHPKVRFME